ncbi:MAG: hypothetical protein FWF20_06000 [Betaproteobacteria bacterium]|nr:hypothetical protein [Betaproteobacteria bacterium]MCL2886325.1 hypothetical protein [Betaproteobacteria bacterium]
MKKRPLLIAAALLALTGCDQINEKLGLESPEKKEARTEAEARAVGGACRHSGRAIEDCYAIYVWLPKAGVYAGWRDMDEYMRENQIETIAPQLPPPEPPPGARKKKRPAADAAQANDEATANDAAEAAADGARR